MLPLAFLSLSSGPAVVAILLIVAIAGGLVVLTFDKERKSMSYDQHRRGSTWHMILPGCWMDPEGYAHLYPDEVIAQLQRLHPEAGWQYTREDYGRVVKAFMQMLRDQRPDAPVKFILVETWL